MRTFYVVHNKQAGMKELHQEADNYIERIGAIATNKQLCTKTVDKVTVGDIMFSPEHGFNFEIVVIK